MVLRTSSLACAKKQKHQGFGVVAHIADQSWHEEAWWLKGNTLLTQAILNRNEWAVELLLSTGSTDIRHDPKDHLKRTSLSLAAEMNLSSCVELYWG